MTERKEFPIDGDVDRVVVICHDRDPEHIQASDVRNAMWAASFLVMFVLMVVVQITNPSDELWELVVNTVVRCVCIFASAFFITRIGKRS